MVPFVSYLFYGSTLTKKARKKFIRGLVLSQAFSGPPDPQSATSGSNKLPNLTPDTFPRPTGLSKEQLQLWEILNKKAKREFLDSKEFETLAKGSPEDLLLLASKYADSYDSPSSFFQKLEILTITFILKFTGSKIALNSNEINNNNGNITDSNIPFEGPPYNYPENRNVFTFLIVDITKAMTEELMALEFRDKVWDKYLSKLSHSSVILESIQIKKVYPIYSVNSPFTLAVSYEASLTKDTDLPEGKAYLIQQTNPLVITYRGQNCINLNFVTKSLKALNSEEGKKYKVILDGLKQYLLQPIKLGAGNNSSDPMSPYAELILVFESSKTGSPLPFTPVTGLSLLGFTTKTKLRKDIYQIPFNGNSNNQINNRGSTNDPY